MKTPDLERLKKIPRALIPGRGKSYAPGMIKRHVAMLCASIDDEWRWISEGCLRNRYFRSQVIARNAKCTACQRKRDDRSRIEQHHVCYLNVCRHAGPLLPADSPDVHRKPRAGEHPDIPDCRACHAQSPENFNECLKRIEPVHAACHERIHDKERYFRTRAKEDLQSQFYDAARSWVPADFYLDDV